MKASQSSLRCQSQDQALIVAEEIEGKEWNQEFIKTRFLPEFWQQKPLFIRNAIDVASLGVDGCDLEHLSQEEDVESRVIRLIKKSAEKEYGPFEENIYKQLRELQEIEPWTVFVQEIDRHIPIVADLWQQHFNFIPSWRRDDIMISYATKDAGIGAHCDDYDVFLIQGGGTREWSIENSYVSPNEEADRLMVNSDTKILKDFTAHQQWILQPGDMLYLPPRIPHRGISLDDECVTISMGFRTPALRSALKNRKGYSVRDFRDPKSQAKESDRSSVPFGIVVGDSAWQVKFRPESVPERWKVEAARMRIAALTKKARNRLAFESKRLILRDCLTACLKIRVLWATYQRM